MPDLAAFCSACGGAAVPAAEQPWAIRITAPVGTPPPAPVVVPVPVREAATPVPWATVFPFREWFGDSMWFRSRWGVFAAFAIAPFVLLRAVGDADDITHVAWAFAVYFGVMWLLVVHQLVRPERPSVGLVLSTVLTTAIAGVAVAVWLEERLGAQDEGLVRMILAVGFPEEIAKALPVVAFLLLRGQSATPRLYLFTGAVSGLAFGVTEAVAYSDFYGSLLEESSASTYTAVVTWRLLTDGLFHACFAGIAAFFIGLAHWHRRWAVQFVAVGVSLAAVLHGAYDHFSSSWLGTAIAVVIVLCFVAYARTGDRIALSMRSAESA